LVSLSFKGGVFNPVKIQDICPPTDRNAEENTVQNKSAALAEAQ